MSLEAKVLIVEGLTTDGILGLDFLQFHKCSINLHKRCLYFSGLRVQIPLSSPISCSTGDVSVSASAAITTSIPAHCEQEILVETNSAVDGIWLMEHNLQNCNCSGLQVAQSLVQSSDTYMVASVLNLSDQPITLHKGTKVAVLYSVEKNDIYDSPVSNPKDTTNLKPQLLCEIVLKAEGLSKKEPLPCTI